MGHEIEFLIQITSDDLHSFFQYFLYNLPHIDGSWLKIMAPTTPRSNPIIYNMFGIWPSLRASKAVKSTLFRDTSPKIGPAGPIERAFATNAIPRLSVIDPIIPLIKNSILNVSTYCQYQNMPTSYITTLVVQVVPKLTVNESKPIFGSVRCFISKDVIMKHIGVKRA